MSLSSDEVIPLQRPAFGNPTTHTASPLLFDPEYDIYFHHPGYPDPHNILLILPGIDHPKGGIHHRIALSACGVLANNNFNGWLTEDREGNVRVELPLDGILHKRDYYFHVPGDHPDPYPIVPSFEDWIFPHERLPPGWKIDIPREASHPTPRQSTLAEAVLSRDIRCRLTNHIEGTECAHLIPRSQSIWFQRNMMSRYGRLPRPGGEPVDTPRNVILLRSDIHSSFDYKRFSFVPKPAHAINNSAQPTGNQPLSYVTHLVNSPEPHELTSLYHNVKLQPLCGVAPEYVFARFAWTIFQYIPMFLQAGVPRRLALYQASTGLTAVGGLPAVKVVSAEECRLMPIREKSRSASPKKRKPDEACLEEDERGRTRQRIGSASLPRAPSFESDITTDGPWYLGSVDTELSDIDDREEGESMSPSFVTSDKTHGPALSIERGPCNLS
ncbi:hypothetical protein BDV37DRAFT_209902 [Aspergillus pseudonomiae]|uniref:HNH nuclease domain-containing protein n=1 Tax=Aspergillus pseudonomiae TaxID=1506151 RepID=A0A5N7D1T6_9EURO|nr:uncharacterized protein BDV37DRAFT_209902 [Aspergillus pseudonomiae]KAE8400375.1 hypothetical protein BDV37DRAFT_209902 [Aspergillus pseudonomiae]